MKGRQRTSKLVNLVLQYQDQLENWHVFCSFPDKDWQWAYQCAEAYAKQHGEAKWRLVSTIEEYAMVKP